MKQRVFLPIVVNGRKFYDAHQDVESHKRFELLHRDRGPFLELVWGHHLLSISVALSDNILQDHCGEVQAENAKR